MSNNISPQLSRAAIDVAVMKKQKENIELQGEAAVDLIESVGEVQKSQPVASMPGKGSLIDVYI